jgi:hypothetical protein
MTEELQTHQQLLRELKREVTAISTDKKDQQALSNFDNCARSAEVLITLASSTAGSQAGSIFGDPLTPAQHDRISKWIPPADQVDNRHEDRCWQRTVTSVQDITPSSSSDRADIRESPPVPPQEPLPVPDALAGFPPLQPNIPSSILPPERANPFEQIGEESFQRNNRNIPT